MRLSAAVFATAAVVCSAGRKAEQQSLRAAFEAQAEEKAGTCDQYCQDEDSGFCSPSPLKDLNTIYPKPDMFVGDNTEYAKCYEPWKGNGRSHPILCPPKPTEGCESCGWSSGGGSLPGTGSAPFSSPQECCEDYYDADGYRFTYDYKWNIANAKRDAYPNKMGSCWGWWGCDGGYECKDRNWHGKGKCQIKSDVKFYGESCDNSDQCNSGITETHAAMACSIHSHTCMLREEAEREHSAGGHSKVQCTCSVFDHGFDFWSTVGFGVFSCLNYKECNGNNCDLTTQDGNKYCKTGQAWSAKCSNCRAGTDSCS